MQRVRLVAFDVKLGLGLGAKVIVTMLEVAEAMEVVHCTPKNLA